ncbi:MAG: hypothetical protein HOH43_00755 [Candidatus Latescibacteria bacterium]|nr:hypothetical protein [Candidatus Latescibacterota bacterium]
MLIPDLAPTSRSHRLREMYWAGEHERYCISKVLTGSEDSSLVGRARDFALLLRESSPVISPLDLLAGLLPVSPAEGSSIDLGHYDGHYTPGNANLIRMGYTGIRDRALEMLATEWDSEKRDFLEATVISYNAACEFAEKHAQVAEELASDSLDVDRSRELARMAASCRGIASGPPETFHAALQMMWFTFMYGARGSIGRFDQWMYPLYIKDIENGALTRSEAQEMLENYFIKLNYVAGNNDSLRNIVLAGQTPDGENAENELTTMCLHAGARLMLPEPKLNVRFYDGSSRELLELSCQLTCMGLSNPAYFNDSVAVPGLVRLGIPIEDARDYCNDGCSELIIGGKSTIRFRNFDTLPMLNDTVRQAHETDVSTFDEVLSQFEERLVAEIPDHSGDRSHVTFPFFAASLDDCLEQAWTGGARYSIQGAIPSQMGNVADGLAAIKQFIFQDQSLDWAELNTALADNFEGHEPLRQKILNRAPKYGNDDDGVDDIIKELSEHFCDTLHEKAQNKHGPGCKLAPGFMTFGIHRRRFLPATPDGRRQEDNVASSFSPGLGRDKHSPTAVLKSVSKVDLRKAGHGSVLDMAFHPTALKGEEGHRKFVSFVDTFLKLQCTTTLQANMVAKETLLAARENPTDPQYRTLLVRVWGFSTVFVTLDPALQQHVIERTQHSL